MGRIKHSIEKKRIVDTLFIVSIIIIAGILAALLLFNGKLRGSAAEPPTPPAAENNDPLENEVLYTVVLDAGHGGGDGGAVGKTTGVVESTLNLKVATYVKELFEAQGVRVIMTREDEDALGETKRADMAERKRIMNLEGVDVIISVHMNKFRDTSVSGPMTFYMKGSTEGERLAKYVIDAVCEALERPKRHTNPGDYFVIREGPVPSVLVECGFLSNPEDEMLLQDEAHQKRIADGIVKGVMEYLNSGAAPQDENVAEPDG